MKVFNTTGVCVPSRHYMVDITDRLKQIKIMIDNGEYFTINRARQYGKTTTLAALDDFICNDYIAITLDFQDIGNDSFINEDTFSKAFCELFLDEINRKIIANESSSLKDTLNQIKEAARGDRVMSLLSLFMLLKRVCEADIRQIVLIIDEVDSATNNQIFLDFLAQLRSQYLKRERNPQIKVFQSVILAGVTDVKHLKSKIRDDEQHKLNSPWNIASDFDIDMSLSRDGIMGMLDEYENDHKTGMDTNEMAGLIHDYTSGYPFLVSRMCQIIDEKLVPAKFENLSDAWTKDGMDEAVKLLLSESNTLFESLIGKLTNYSEIKEALRSILFSGEKYSYNQYQEPIAQLQMYGFIKNENGTVRIFNRIFETFLYNWYLSDVELSGSSFSREGELGKSIFIKNGCLDMLLILEHFISTYTQIFGPLEDKFKEKDGREHFLLYIKSIINGTGNYYIEAQTRNQTRTDVVIDYLGRQYVIELKIWRGERYNADGEKQISEYLDYFGLDTGYMLSFNFNKKKEQGIKKIEVDGKTLYEATL